MPLILLLLLLYFHYFIIIIIILLFYIILLSYYYYYHGCEVWLLKTEEQRNLLVLQMDYLRRSAGVSRLQKIPNTAIRSKMQAEQQF